ncbi:MAG: L-ribulose-5-phosphate 4-epimerase [Endomicrobium sp.]|jgi:L-ribulose-5-phosphate 4-epimerase|nr:L-ribulose-5-phosphate 4-epimerase [Endomicrobium sp.]
MEEFTILKELRKLVYEANMSLVKYNLIKFTWGNVSAIDRKSGIFIIKPSGVQYDDLSPENMVVLNLKGEIVEGKLNPSSDTDTHLILYQKFPNIRAVVHTHSPWATSFAQAGFPIYAAGTTHADTFYGDVPVTRKLTKNEVQKNYEKQTGIVITETFEKLKINPDEIPAVLVNDHAPFVWGNPQKAVYNAVVLEECAKMLYRTICINSKKIKIDQYILDKHFLRKHGKNAYYGQK